MGIFHIENYTNMTQEELRNKLEVKIAIWITKGLGNKEDQGTKMLNDMVSLINQHVKEEKEKIADQLRNLPFHPEVIGHEGGNSIAQVTYTHHIVDIENELRK